MADQDIKRFNLKKGESQLLIFIRNQQQAQFSAMLSYIAAERLSYPVSERTQFKLNADLSEVEITELSDADLAEAQGVPVAQETQEASPKETETSDDASPVKQSDGAQIAG